MSDSPYIFDVTADNFEDVVLTGSMQCPVIVDFWADWCQPCQSLMPILSKLADEYQGKFILAKVNADQNQELTAQFAVRSLPTIKLFKGGQPVDEFMGALPESEIRRFLEPHMEQAPGDTRDTAIAAFNAGNTNEAIRLLEEALQLNPGKTAIVVDLANILAQSGDIEKAKTLLSGLPADEQAQPDVASLLAKLSFASDITDLPDPEVLRVAAEQGDLKAMSQLVTFSIANDDYQSALELSLNIMKKDRGFEEDLGRKTLLKIFDMMGSHPLVDEYRRKMASVLY